MTAPTNTRITDNRLSPELRALVVSQLAKALAATWQKQQADPHPWRAGDGSLATGTIIAERDGGAA